MTLSATIFTLNESPSIFIEICNFGVLWCAFDRQRVCQAEENNRYCIQYTDSYHLSPARNVTNWR